VNLRKLLEDPPDMDIVLWIQGTAAVAYLEKGQYADMTAQEQFVRMTQGSTLMYAFWFN
jgi:hypothetical protein